MTTITPDHPVCRNDTDSAQLYALRQQMRREGFPPTFTAYRMGRFARTHDLTITDKGGHSKKWWTLFNQGYRDARIEP